MTHNVLHRGYGITNDLSASDLGNPDRPRLAHRFPLDTEGLGHRHGDLQAVLTDPFRVGRLDRRQCGAAVPHADLNGALYDLQVQQARAGRVLASV